MWVMGTGGSKAREVGGLHPHARGPDTMRGGG